MSLFTYKKVEMPDPERALPGRGERMQVPERHFVNGNQLEPPFSEGDRSRPVRNGLLLGR